MDENEKLEKRRLYRVREAPAPNDMRHIGMGKTTAKYKRPSSNTNDDSDSYVSFNESKASDRKRPEERRDEFDMQPSLGGSNHSGKQNGFTQSDSNVRTHLTRQTSNASTVTLKSFSLETSTFRKNHSRYWRSFSNLAYVADEDDEGASDIHSLVDTIGKNTEDLEDNLNLWEQHKEEIEEGSNKVHEDIEKQRLRLIDNIEEYAQSLHERADAITQPRLDNTKVIIGDIQETLHNVEVFTEENSRTARNSKDIKQLRERLKDLCNEVDKMNISPPEWLSVCLTKTNRSKHLVSSLFGTLEGGAAGPGWLAGLTTPRRQGSTRSTSSTSSSHLDSHKDDDPEDSKDGESDDMLLYPLVLKNSFCCKSAKDIRECGVTDIAVTINNEILIVDKHNKLVKQFSCQGTFEKYIGHRLVKEPSRVSVLSSSGQILVTDNAARDIKIFHRDGSYIGEFGSDLKYPICHCETYDKKIAVLEFATKTVLVYDETGKPIHTFPTHMVCPAYLACTRNGNIVVTDWKANKMTIFDVTGNEVHSHQSIDPETDKVLPLPHGLTADSHGNILVTEKRQHCIQVFSEDGDLLKTYDQDTHKLKLPMSVAHNGYELLAVAEYQGQVKLFKYINLTFDHFGGQRCKMKPKAKGTIVPEDVKVKDMDAETVF